MRWFICTCAVRTRIFLLGPGAPGRETCENGLLGVSCLAASMFPAAFTHETMTTAISPIRRQFKILNFVIRC